MIEFRRTQNLVLSYLALLLFIAPPHLHAEETPLTAHDVARMTLDELLDHEITTASKKTQHVFESPLSSTVLTSEEISKSGATSIPEALRLVPGVIVREQTNGVYDVHLRGFDYLPEGAVYNKASNSMTLVMIDNRVVYNYLSGGTFWETLPVDLHDIDKIEVVRGPASVLYGPNAVTGVIHIITRTLKKDGAHSEAHIEGGRYETMIARGRAGYRWGDQLSITASANGQTRERKDIEYFSSSSGDFVSDPADLSFVTVPRPLTNPDERYPNKEKSLEKAGANLFIDASPADDVHLEFDAGLQDSRAKSIFHDNDATPLTTSDTESYYLHSRNHIGEATVILSYLDGDQDVQGAPEFSFDFTTYDAQADYNINLGNLRLLPGTAFRRVEYGGGNRFEEGDPAMDLWSGSLHTEWQDGDFSLNGGARADRYDHRSKTFVSYEAGAGYQPNKDNFFRLRYGRAYRSPFMEETFQVLTFVTGDTTRIQGLGNDDLDLVTNDTVETGWRSRLTESLESDIEIFWSRNKDYADIFPDGTVRVEDGITYANFPYQQIDLEAEQWGATFSLLFSDEECGLSGRVFATVQKTHLHDSLLDQTDPSTGTSGDHENTPSVYGGFYLNWLPIPRWNINLSSYFYSDTTQVARLQETSVAGKVLMNLKTSYQVADDVSFFLNARNLLNNDNREFANADQIDGLYLAGLAIDLN